MLGTPEGYWPWWLGAAVLAIAAVAYLLLMGRPFGTTGIWARALFWRQEKKLYAAEAPFANRPDKLKDALLAATLEEFGEAALAGQQAETQPVRPSLRQSRAPWSANITFLVALAAGGMLAAVAAGRWQVTAELAHEYSALFGNGWTAWLPLLVGGFLAGFGSRMAGGCTSWHGLYGCARMQPGSLVATILFLGLGAATCFVLAGILR